MVQWGILLMVVVMIFLKKSCALHPWEFTPVVESATMYKCGQVQSAQ